MKKIAYLLSCLINQIRFNVYENRMRRQGLDWLGRPLILVSFLLIFAGCAHERVPSSARSSAVIDHSLLIASSGVAKAQSSIVTAQNKAHEIYQTYTNVVTNTVLRQDFVDMQSALSDSFSQLATVSTNLFTATNNLAWYEQDYLATHKVADSQAVTIRTQIASISWWRSRALWGWGIIFSVILGVLVYFAGPWLGKIAGAVLKTP